MAGRKAICNPAPGPIQRLTADQVQVAEQAQPRITCSLLVPLELTDYVRMRCQQHGGLKKYFASLLCTYGCNLDYYDAEPEHKGLRKLYQPNGPGYTRLDFQPDPLDWEQMRNLSSIYGPSICWMFVHLVRLEIRRWSAAGQPDFFQEQPPERPGSPEFARNSMQKSWQALEMLRQAAQEASDIIVQLRLTDQRHRKLLRFGLIRL
ncbi:MAG: DUF1564 family protein [Leptospiraceae bacterium]|nr:DUF1564 family protein [Leptospiraceae bacterium]